MRFSIIAMSMLLSLSACAPAVKEQPEGIMQAHVKTIPPEQRAAMLARIESAAVGFPVGTGAPNKAFVFFDPGCNYCSDLWREARLLKRQVDFVWVPVGVLGEESTTLAALILDSADPAGIMSANEESFRTTGEPMATASVPTEASLSKVAANTDLMARLDPAAPIQSTPLMYYKSANGHIELIAGALDAKALKSALKLD